MTRKFTRGTIKAKHRLAAAFTLMLGLGGCGGQAPDSGEAVVRPPAGENAPSLEPIPAPGTSTPTPAAKTAASTSPAPAVSAEGWGTFKGQVVFGGSPPEVVVLQEKGKAAKNPEFCAKDAPIKSERLLVNSENKGVKNVLVYFPKPTKVNEESKSARASTDVVFDQEKCIFVPHVLSMMLGSKVTLKSSDEVNHNINAKLQKNATFNSLLAPGGSAPFVATDAERGPIPVTCDIHPWMQAWWMILDNPYFATTDEKGNFEIKNVPAGTQKVVVWQEATGFVTKPSGEEVTIKAGDAPTTKDWTIAESMVKPAQ